MAESLVGHLGYLGIVLVLVLGGLGLPVPEEVPILLAAVLSQREALAWPLALAACLGGVLAGDFIVYGLGFVYGERVLNLALTRKFLTRAREAQIKGYFHRHGVKILILGRLAPGFRTAAYLTAGILRLPTLKLFLTDLFAASLTTGLMFGIGYGLGRLGPVVLHRAQRWLGLVLMVAAAGFLAWRLYLYIQARRRAGRPVGPPVPVSDLVPLPPDDLHPGGLPPGGLPPPPLPPQPPTAPDPPTSVEARPPLEPQP